jgi:hypothetical protein
MGFTNAKAKSRPRPRFIAWSIQTMANYLEWVPVR